MADYTAKRIEDMEAAYGGGFVKARAELGVSSFGLQVIQLPPNSVDYPEHDHVEDAQEEVFLALSGSGWIEIDGERVDLDEDTLVRVGPAAKRKVFAGPDGLRVLALGGAPGEIYKINAMTELDQRVATRERAGRLSARTTSRRPGAAPWPRSGARRRGRRRAGRARPASACSGSGSTRAPLGTPPRLRWTASASVPVARPEASTVNGIFSSAAV